MNEQQAFAAVRNAIRLENLSRDVAAKVTPELAVILKQVREMIRTMPPGNLEREIRYRQFQQQLAGMLRGVNDSFYFGLTEELRQEVEEQVKWARGYLQKAAGDPMEQVAAIAPRDGVTLAAESGLPTQIGFRGGQFTRTQLVAITQKTEVLGKRLDTLFGIDGSESLYIRDNLKLIDRTVKQGFLLGETNEQIAQRLPGMGRQALARNRAIARTAVMDMSQKAHETFWDAQEDVLAGKLTWQFDASLDYRVCMQCAPFDGKEVAKRSELPEVPVHPNCRCRILPITATERELRRSGESLSQVGERSYVEITENKPSTGRVYKQKVKVDGKRFYKVARDAQPQDGRAMTMGGFLQRANNATRESVMGKENAKRFGQLVRGTEGTRAKMTADEALQEIARNPYRRRK